VLAANDTKFIWDNTNFRLGIGTATPSESLETTGNIKGVIHKFVGQTGLAAPTGGSSSQWSNGSSSAIYYNGGYVGIGTTSPQNTLQVGPDLTLQGNWPEINFNLNSVYATKYITSNSASTIFQDYTNNGLAVWTAPSGTAGATASGGTRMFISGTGNVGIGTTSPAQKLDVNGNLLLEGYNTLYVGTNLLLGGNQFNVSSGCTYCELAINYSGYSNAILNLYNGSGASKVVLNPNGNSYFNGGNVGIGTTTISMPVTGKTPLLEVYQTGGSPTIGSYVNSTSAFNHLVFNNPNGEVGQINSSGSATIYGTSSDQRLKDHIRDFDASKIDALISKLRPRQWEWKYAEGHPHGEGFIAQELVDVVPDAVVKGDDNPDLTPKNPNFKMWTVDYGKLTTVLAAAVKLDRDAIAKLKADNDNQAAGLKALEAKFESYKAAHP